MHTDMARVAPRPLGGLDLGGLVHVLHEDYGAVVEEYDVCGIGVTVELALDRRTAIMALARRKITRNRDALLVAKGVCHEARAHAHQVRALLDSLEPRLGVHRAAG